MIMNMIGSLLPPGCRREREHSWKVPPSSPASFTGGVDGVGHSSSCLLDLMLDPWWTSSYSCCIWQLLISSSAISLHSVWDWCGRLPAWHGYGCLCLCLVIPSPIQSLRCMIYTISKEDMFIRRMFFNLMIKQIMNELVCSKHFGQFVPLWQWEALEKRKEDLF